MRYWFLSCLLLLPSFATAAENSVTEWEQKLGWTSLFDGQTTTGWRNYKQDKISAGWKVVDGALTRADKGASIVIGHDQAPEIGRHPAVAGPLESERLRLGAGRGIVLGRGHQSA